MAKKRKTESEISPRNFVTKNMHKFCNSRVYRDSKNDYSRKTKHRDRSYDDMAHNILCLHVA